MSKPDMTNPIFVLESLKSADSNSYCATAIGRSIGYISSAGKKLDARVHATGVALMYRAADHGDCSLVPNLLAALPMTVRRKALVAWFHAFSNIRLTLNKDGTYKVSMLKKDHKDWAEPQLAEAMDRPFWTATEKDTDPAVFTDKRFAAAVAALVKKAQEAADLSPATLTALGKLKDINLALTPAA